MIVFIPGLEESAGVYKGFSINHVIEEGKLRVAFTRIGKAEPIYGDVELYCLNFRALKKENAEVSLESVKVVDSMKNSKLYKVTSKVSTQILPKREPSKTDYPESTESKGKVRRLEVILYNFAIKPWYSTLFICCKIKIPKVAS